MFCQVDSAKARGSTHPLGRMAKRLLGTVASVTVAVSVLATIPVPGYASDRAGFSIPAEPRGPGVLPACDHAQVVGRIQSRFAWAENNTWHRGFVIDAIDHVRDRGEFRDGISTIGRRWCQGRAHLSDGKQGTIYYLIEERLGFASLSWNVEFCLPAYDPWLIYGGRCRVLAENPY